MIYCKYVIFQFVVLILFSSLILTNYTYVPIFSKIVETRLKIV